jgi:N-alpha-acetyl-L-2,4-diaminobutyrate deacetylase
MHYLDDEDQMKQTFAALEAFNAPFSLVMNEFSGAGLLDYAVEGMGKIFLCAELGGGGRLSGFTMQIAETGTRNLLKHFGILQGELTDWGQATTHQSQFMEIPSSQNYHIAYNTGIYEPLVDLGQPVNQGESLGQIHFVDQLNRSPEQIIAQRTGILLGIRSPSNVTVGDCVALVAEKTSSIL